MKKTKEERINDFLITWQTFVPQESNYLVSENKSLMEFLTYEGFFMAPASKRFHGAYEGGLYDHSSAVANRLIELTEKNDLAWQRNESPFIVGMFHDLCKYDQYVKADGAFLKDADVCVTGDPSLYHYEYNDNALLKGHGSKSVMILSRFINLTEEEMLCIRYHMGAFEKDEWKEFNMAISKYPNVLWTHMADMLVSQVDNI